MKEEFENRRREIKDLLHKILGGSLVGSSYSFNKQSIKNLFKQTNEDTEEDILLRLTVIDSMYSTQMNKRYYGLEDLANAMYTLKTEKGCSMAKLFIDFAKTPDVSIFGYSGGNLLENNYGIGKDGEQKGTAVSLISKYAYFATEYQFPIFDSIVCETLPSLCGYLGVELECMSKYSLKGDITAFVKAINEFFHKMKIDICYDSFDRLVWFVGKIRRGNLSLILSKDEYLGWTKIHKIENEEDVVFDITKDSYGDISTFLNPKNKDLMEQFFKIAKELGPVRNRK